MIRRFEIIVYGRVQGVGFRFSADNQAKSRNLQGWVKNCPDGTVHSMVQGEESSCQAYIQWCREGPQFGRVEKIEVKEHSLTDLQDFSVRY